MMNVAAYTKRKDFKGKSLWRRAHWCYDICYTQRDIDNDIIFCLSRDNTVY